MLKDLERLNNLLQKQQWQSAKKYCQKLLLSYQKTDLETVEKSQPVSISKRAVKFGYSEIIGSSAKIQQVLTALDRITPTEISVWIQGESGTGKELVARALHFNHPQRKAYAFVTENCSAIPENLIESLLFGYVKGAFTHADRDKEGLFEAAHRGTIFLDEIGDMPLSMQAKLLRVLQEKEIRRVGSNEAIPIDVRIISATNKNLAHMVEKGTFREDLYFRLNGFKLSIPPLRERAEDIPQLCEFFLKKYNNQRGVTWTLDKSALEVLMHYTWPGNIRELENTVHNAMLFSETPILSKQSFLFKSEIFEVNTKTKSVSKVALPISKETQVSNLTKDTQAPRELLLEALSSTNFHKGKAAAKLDITTRHLYNLLEKFQLPKNKWALRRLVAEEKQAS